MNFTSVTLLAMASMLTTAAIADAHFTDRDRAEVFSAKVRISTSDEVAAPYLL
jgi:hypothetical protein